MPLASFLTVTVLRGKACSCKTEEAYHRAPRDRCAFLSYGVQAVKVNLAPKDLPGKTPGSRRPSPSSHNSSRNSCVPDFSQQERKGRGFGISTHEDLELRAIILGAPHFGKLDAEHMCAPRPGIKDAVTLTTEQTKNKQKKKKEKIREICRIHPKSSLQARTQMHIT